MSNVTALQNYRQQQTFSLVPRTFEQAMQFAELMASSDMVPKDYRNKPANVLVAVQMGADLNLSPMQALQGICVINGRPSVWGDAMKAIVEAHPACRGVYESDMQGDATAATCTVKRAGRPDVTRSFSVEDAKRAGLWGKQGPWTQYPQRMLMMRARAFALRDAFPDALRGLSCGEEVQDYSEQAKPSEYVQAKAEYVESRPNDLGQADSGVSTEPSEDEVSLYEVLAAIESARTREELSKAGVMARKLPRELKSEAIAAGVKKQAEIDSGATGEDDPDTGE